MDEPLVSTDMLTFEEVKSGAFDEMGSTTHYSLDIWAWVLPSTALQLATTLETQETRLPRWRRRQGKIINDTKDRQECLITPTEIVEGVACYILVDLTSLKPMRAWAICPVKVLTVAEKGLKWRQEVSHHWIHNADETKFSGTVIDLGAIKMRDEATKLLDT